MSPPSTTNTFNTNAEFPYTMTLPNQAVVAYADTTKFNDYWSGAGSSTLVQAGMRMTVNVNGSHSANVGTLTGDALYTSVSDALEAACPLPTDSSTITGCAGDAAITGLTYVDATRNVQSSGKLEIEFDWVSYHRADVFDGLVQGIAQVLRRSTQQPENTSPMPYCFSKVDGVESASICDDEIPPGAWPTLNTTTIPDMVQAIFTEQDAHTNGEVDIQFMQVAFKFEASTPFSCAMAAFAMDTFALFTDGIGGAVGASVMSCNCFAEDLGTA